MKTQFIIYFLAVFAFSFAKDNPYILVLGTAQDGGKPHAGCEKDCCENLWDTPDQHHKVSAIAIVDPISEQAWIIDATPDFSEQLNTITTKHHADLKGIFLTHAHIGHYTGLMDLGHEVMGFKDMPVYTMPRMKDFLNTNGPWDQLVKFNNIAIQRLKNNENVYLTSEISITPFLVPHRDEYSETVGYKIKGPNKSLIFIPDIDKWSKWDRNIHQEIKTADFALLDGTFYANGEIPNRDMSQIPHPFITETMEIFKSSTAVEKHKIHFIHLNHTNPASISNSDASITIINRGFNIAQEGQTFKL